MSFNLHLSSGLSKEEYYISLLPQLRSLINNESDPIANMANISAALKQSFNFFWVGFYLVKQDELVLGPFQGTIACTRIKYGRGVCGNAWKQGRTLIVPDVNEFPGHIACDTASKSEIVLPIFKDNIVWGVLDVDSDQLRNFGDIDAEYLQQVVHILESRL